LKKRKGRRKDTSERGGATDERKKNQGPSIRPSSREKMSQKLVLKRGTGFGKGPASRSPRGKEKEGTGEEVKKKRGEQGKMQWVVEKQAKDPVGRGSNFHFKRVVSTVWSWRKLGGHNCYRIQT